MGVYEKLLQCQIKLKAPKSQYNAFGKYSYRNSEDILKALKPVLKDNECTIIINDDVIDLNGRYYIKSTITFMDIETGESIQVSAMARESETKTGMDASQITGASSSYARKYALNGLLCIDDTKDMDGGSPEKPSDGKITKAQASKLAKQMVAKFNDKNVALVELEKLGYKSTSEIPADKFEDILAKFS